MRSSIDGQAGSCSSPDPGINNLFYNLKRYLQDNRDCHLEIGYNEELSHLVYAGSDIVLVPSEYEPCGLTQLIGLKYGTLFLMKSPPSVGADIQRHKPRKGFQGLILPVF